MKRILAIALVGALGLFSCQTDLVVTTVDIVAEPSMAFPLGSVNLTMEHLLAPDDSLIFDDNTNYKVVVAQDSVFGINVNDLIEIPAQSPSSNSISMGTIAVDNVTMSQSISLGDIAADAGLTAINAAHGSNAPFPSMNETNIGTYGSGGFGSFSSASFSSGTLSLELTNNWPVPVTLNVDLVNTANGNTIVSYSLANVSPNGGSSTDTESLINKTLPNSIGFKITSLTSPGSGTSFVGVDTTDNLVLDISSSGLEVYSAVTQISSQTISSDTQFVDLSTGGSEELRELMFSTASFDFEFESTLGVDVELDLKFPGSNKNGSEIDTTILITAGNTTIGSINMNNAILDLTQDPSQNHSRLPLIVNASLVGSTNMVTVDSSDALDMTFEMANINFGHIKGFFGSQQINIDPGTVDLAIEFLDNFEGAISFAEPSISMDITNSIGLPIEMVLDFTSFKDGVGYSLNGPNYVLPYPSTLGNTATGILTYDNGNSSIVDVFTLPKDSIVYEGEVNINHDVATFGTDNFVTSASSISGDLLMEMPFYFTASGLAFGDTLAENLDNADLPDNLTIESAKILLQATTTLPLDANVQIKFYDGSWNEILMKDLGVVIESGTPDASGIIISPNIFNSELALDASEALSVLNAKHIIAEANMNTYNAGNDPVKLRTDATLKLDLGVQVQVKYEYKQ